MHLSKKIQFTLDELFASFDMQQVAIIHENIKQTCHCLDSSGHKLLTLMQNKKICYDQFLSRRCLPLIRFYLAPINIQQQTFLSKEKLAAFFSEIPTVEAYLFKNTMILALQHRKNTQQNTLTFTQASKQGMPTLIKKEHFHQQTQHYSKQLYQVKAGNLEISDNQLKQQQAVLSYVDLSPLQQLQAQKLCKEKYNLISA